MQIKACRVFTLVIAAAGLVLAPYVSANGQGAGAGQTRRAGSIQEGPQSSPQPKPSLSTDVKLPWPRLDPGAVFCRTADDLVRHASAVQIRATGGPASASARPDCRIVTAPTAIEIVSRAGMGQTEVRLRHKNTKPGEGETGWTDVWLPERAH
jgi:hypothetical protein